VIFCHYSFATEVTRVFLQTLEEACRTVVFFLMMEFFIKMSSKLLRHRKLWLNIHKTLWSIGLLIFVFIELFVIVEVAKEQVTDQTQCDNSTYLIMQVSNTILLVAFVILGFFVNKRVIE
jgi:hypothetical protein